jgi:hypothetical protein
MQKNKATVEKRLSELEQRNIELKNRLTDYKNDGNDQWDAFKVEYNHDVKEFGKAFSDLTIRNTN